MICQSCGNISATLTPFCTGCGTRNEMQPAFASAQAVVGASFNPPEFSSAARPAFAGEQASYADFISRFFAFVIDEVIAGFIAAFVYGLIAALGSLFVFGGMGGRNNAGLICFGLGALLWVIGIVLGVAAYVAYFVKLETSSRHATLGKTILGMKVVNGDGGGISVGQSLGRLVIKNLLSGLIFGLGFLMALFTERKQALHDLAAGTLVVRH